MTRRITRRRVLGAGATLGIGSIAGCRDRSDGGDDTATDAETDTPPETVSEVPAVADGGGILPAQYAVTKAEGEIRSKDGEGTAAHPLVDTDGSIGNVTVRNNRFEGGGRNALTSLTESGRHIGTFVVGHNAFEFPRGIGLPASAERLPVRENLFECTGDAAGRLAVKECGSGVDSGNVLYDASIAVADGVDAVVERNHSFPR